MNGLTWPLAAIAVMIVVSAIITTRAAIVASRVAKAADEAFAQNKEALEVVHKLVNSRFFEVSEKLKAALETIAKLSAERVETKALSPKETQK